MRRVSRRRRGRRPSPPATAPSLRGPVGRLGLLAAMASIVLACTGGDDDVASPTSVVPSSTVPSALIDALAAPIPPDAHVIGAVLDLTGPRAAADVSMGVAVEAEVSRVQAAGGVGGRPIALVVADSGGTVLGATNAAGQLAERGAIALVLGCDSDLALAAAEVAQIRNVLAVAPCAVAPELGLGPPGWLTFQLAIPATTQGRLLADYAIEAGRTTAITLSEAVDLDALTLCGAFVDRYRELGGEIIAEIEVDPAAVPLDQVAETVARFEVPGIMTSCLREPAASGALFDLNLAALTTVPLLLSSGGDNSSLVAAMPGDVLALGPPLGALLPEQQALLDAGLVRGPTDLGGVAAVQLAVAALDRAAGATSGTILSAALEQAGALELAVGPVTFTSTDHAGAARSVVLRGHAADGSAFAQERLPAAS